MESIAGLKYDPRCSSLTLHLDQHNQVTFCRCELRCEEVFPGNGTCPCDKITPGECKIAGHRPPTNTPNAGGKGFDIRKALKPAGATVNGAPNDITLCRWAFEDIVTQLKAVTRPDNDDANAAVRKTAEAVGCSLHDMARILAHNGEGWQTKVRQAVAKEQGDLDVQPHAGKTPNPKGGAKPQMFKTVADLQRPMDEQIRRSFSVVMSLDEITSDTTVWQVWEMYQDSCRPHRTEEETMIAFSRLSGVPLGLLQEALGVEITAGAWNDDPKKKGGKEGMIDPNNKGYYMQTIGGMPHVRVLASGLPSTTPLCQWMYSLVLAVREAAPDISGADVGFYLACILGIKKRDTGEYSAHAASQGVAKGAKLGRLPMSVEADILEAIRSEVADRPARRSSKQAEGQKPVRRPRKPNAGSADTQAAGTNPPPEPSPLPPKKAEEAQAPAVQAETTAIVSTGTSGLDSMATMSHVQGPAPMVELTAGGALSFVERFGLDNYAKLWNDGREQGKAEATAPQVGVEAPSDAANSG